ncbi:alpha-(1,3)-fucosyltransferase 7-like [Amia ocellicauda]|uniref:alpha-(1,3)-fucosyltransferase 7-like n=1 Tax=Amia ocellicauda TaxID=2972642 RepID=UPI0034639C84
MEQMFKVLLPAPRLQLLLLPLLLVLLLIWYNPQLLPLGRGAPRPHNVTVLVWHWPFAYAYPLHGDVCNTNNGLPSCHLTDNRSLYEQADAVIFHHREITSRAVVLPINRPRPPGQKWVWMCVESPSRIGNLTWLNGLFNWTLTYQRNADIYVPYGKRIPRRGNSSSSYTIPQKRSDKLACWVVSNYKERHRRTTIAKELSELIPLDMYGHSVNKPLDQRKLWSTISQYRFYLAFENSEHHDYITEKLWRNSYMSGTVPVVLGAPRSDYEAVAPPNSFIHVDDFPSARELAEFLRAVASNETRYQQYFQWHRDWEVQEYRGWLGRICEACVQYHNAPSRKVYQDLQGWFGS